MTVTLETWMLPWAFGAMAVMFLIRVVMRSRSGRGDWYDGLIWGVFGFTFLAVITPVLQHLQREHDVARASREAEAPAIRQQGAKDAELGIPYEASGLCGWQRDHWREGWVGWKRGVR